MRISPRAQEAQIVAVEEVCTRDAHVDVGLDAHPMLDPRHPPACAARADARFEAHATPDANLGPQCWRLISSALGWPTRGNSAAFTRIGTIAPEPAATGSTARHEPG